jgi:transitional endoplasmic reticulum ATPase
VVADVAHARFYAVNGPELLGGGPGAAEERLRQLFTLARENRPAILFFDEIDALAETREGPASLLQGRVVQQLLTLLDGFEATDGVIVLAATNRPVSLDPALLRPGRFDRLVFVPLPDSASRRAQWELALRGRPGAETLDYDRLSVASAGYTGAEIRHVANQIGFAKVRDLSAGRDPGPLTTDDVLAALAAVRPQVDADMLRAYDAMARVIRR